MEGRRFLLVFVGATLAAGLHRLPARAEHTHCRAGCPLQVACFAQPSDTSKYIGYYVGGGGASQGFVTSP